MNKAYRVAKEILYKRTSPYEGIKAEALIMLEIEFPIFTGDPNELNLVAGEYSDHDIHDAQHNWPYNLFPSMPIEDFATHIVQVGEEKLPHTDWIKHVYDVGRFMEPGNLFSVMGHTYMKIDDVRIVELTNGARVPFNYTVVNNSMEMVWSTITKLEECTNTLIDSGRLGVATKSVTMDNELRLRKTRPDVLKTVSTWLMDGHIPYECYETVRKSLNSN
jgi:hypothetical protein